MSEKTIYKQLRDRLFHMVNKMDTTIGLLNKEVKRVEAEHANVRPDEPKRTETVPQEE